LPRSIHHVQPKLKFIPPAFNPLVLRIVQWFLPILLRFRIQPWLPAGITRIETANVEGLVELYRHRQVKFAFLAVRHVEVDDPLCGISAFRAVPQVARQRGISCSIQFILSFMNEAYGQVLSSVGCCLG